MEIKEGKNRRMTVERKNYHSEQDYQQASNLEKALDKMEKDFDIKSRRCFECRRTVKKKDSLELYPNLDKWVKICPKCKRKFSNFAIKQMDLGKKDINWYDAKYQKSLLPKNPKNKIPLPKIKNMSWLIDTEIGEYIGDEHNNRMLNIIMENGKIYRGKYIGNWK